MSELKILCLPPVTIDVLWPTIRDRLAPAVERSRGMIVDEEVFENLQSGRWLCWTAYSGNDLKAAVVTRIIQTRAGKRVLQALLAGGEDRKLWQRPIVDRLIEYMKAEDCNSFRIVGRKGWERIYPEFKVQEIVLELTA